MTGDVGCGPGPLPFAEMPACSRPPGGLTVAVLTYNSAGTIAACLDSLVGQDEPPLEVLIVDDHSEDATLTLVDGYRATLPLRVVENGSHSIPRGRNLALRASRTDWVAFIDSDDRALPDWTRTIRVAADDDPGLALVYGPRLAASRSLSGEAIALNDGVIRKWFGGGVLQFCTCNCALNRAVLPPDPFNEQIRFGEDIELFERVSATHRTAAVPDMLIEFTSRATFGAYAKQMYQYGEGKLYYDYLTRSLRAMDLVPLAVLVAGVVGGLRSRRWWLSLTIVPFSLSEAAVVVAAERCPPAVAWRTFPAWLTKNLAWSAGTCRGAVLLALRPALRRRLRASRMPAPGP